MVRFIFKIACHSRLTSLLKSTQIDSADTSNLRRVLCKQVRKNTLLWISGHHGIAGNEEADACAKHAQQLPPPLLTDHSLSLWSPVS